MGIWGAERQWQPGAGIASIWTDAGWLYLAALLGACSRLIVGWAMNVYRDEDLVEATLPLPRGRKKSWAGNTRSPPHQPASYEQS